MNKEKLSFIKGALFSFIVSIAAGYAFASWTPAPGSPPGNNVQPPINVGATTQTKSGSLTVAGQYFASTDIIAGRVLVGKVVSSVTSGWIDVAGKIRSSSTADADTGTTVATKDYVDRKAGQTSALTGTVTYYPNARSRTELGTHVFCAMGFVQNGWNTSIGNAHIGVVRNADGTWTARGTCDPNMCTAYCLD